MNDPHDQQIPPVVVDAPSRPDAGNYRVPHANLGWEEAGAATSSGRVAIVGCLGLGLLILGTLCILVWALSSF